MAPLLLRNLITSLFIYADKSLLVLSDNYKLLHFLRHLLVSSFLFFLSILPFFSSSFDDFFPRDNWKKSSSGAGEKQAPCVSVGDSGIARALSQLLSLVNDIPVSSRKYEIVRSLAERIVDDNLKGDFESLRDVNRAILLEAFDNTLNRLRAAMLDVEDRGAGAGAGAGDGVFGYALGRIIRAVRCIGDRSWTRVMKPRDQDVSLSGLLAEKFAAELLWLSQKLADCGYVEEAVSKWASASNLGWLSLLAEPRLQGSLVKVSAFLFKQAKDIGREVEYIGIDKKEQLKETKTKMLMSWIPLLCRASNGTDAPILSNSERAELERVLEQIIDMLGEEEQERVLSLWIHHFTYCSSSDWPNLHACYTRWCTSSRKLLLHY